ncbi:MAG: Gfo/Idh/MocA family oxidoreductase [Candidatus Hydrogenedentes bacterium]|nr:Gfo/Idh/MocA family oxidoreductase [Candidatus Hydrogenedentota bacterium]
MTTKKQFSRRDFLYTGVRTLAGFTLAPTLIPNYVFGAEGSVSPNERITLACIGVGGQGKANMRAFLSLPEVQVVAVCDVDAHHAEEAKNIVNEFYAQKKSIPNYKGCGVYRDFREVLSRGDIDAVMIATPDHWHAIISIESAKAGKDIYCEKPLANSIPEGKAVVETVRKYKRVFQTGSHERSRDNARFACELVRNGRIGKLHTIRVFMPIDNHGPIPPQPEMPVPPWFDYDFWLGPAPKEPYTEKRCHFWFRYILDYSGGEMTDRGAHIIDLGQLGNGTDHTTPISVEGTGFFPKEGLFNTAMSYEFRFEYANGVELIGKSVGPRGIKFEGDKGWIFIHIHGGDLRANPLSLLKETIGPNEIHLGRSKGHHKNFIECVKTRQDPMAPVEVGYHTATMCHMANIAMRLGRKLNWDPEKEMFVNDDEANRMMQPSMRSPWRLG